VSSVLGNIQGFLERISDTVSYRSSGGPYHRFLVGSYSVAHLVFE
jgi:hypothetical protein